MDQSEILLPAQHTVKDYKSDIKPVWCPGCGHFGVQTALFKALAHLNLPPEQVAIISGIGCSSRLPAYTTGYGFHGVHGRALAVATGLKLARPELTVLVVSGDGDGFSIGGNHFLHACRRNVDLTYIVMDNEVYGMTKGQPSPTTPSDWDSKIAPGGTGVSPFLPLAVALSAGANFIARGYAGESNEVARLLVEAIRHPGFAFVQVLSQCITFRPEEKDWKKSVHATELAPTSDPVEAARRLVGDDSLTTGIVYAGNRPPYRISIQPAQSNLNPVEESFVVMNAVVHTLEELLAHAHALESEAVERYEALAEQMEVHNNPELAELFHQMAAVERKHVDKVENLAVDIKLPRLAPWGYRWQTPEAPETVPVGQSHYRLVPYQALSLMIACEERAQAFFEGVASDNPDSLVHAMAIQMAAEEKQHAELLRQWQNRYPEPEPDWQVDLDEPVSQE
jgi:2-oxoglutarate ferredoxin oxidoreductase subunit beta